MKNRALHIVTVASGVVVVFNLLVFSVSALVTPTGQPNGISCKSSGLASFCAEQVITENGGLSFVSLPASFNFPTLTTSAMTQQRFSLAANAKDPAQNLLAVEDQRLNGGFEVTVSAASAFSSGTNSIPLENLSILTSAPAPGNGIVPDTAIILNGMAYDSAIPVVMRNVNAPLDAGNQKKLDDITLFSRYGSAFGKGDLPGAITLMNAGLSAGLGRNGRVYQSLNYFLNIPPAQTPGSYHVNLLFTLLDSTN